MKYKNIKSVAHNIGHSFLSDMNARTQDGRYVIVPRLLFQTAEKARVWRVTIDLASGAIDPAEVATAEVRDAVEYYARWLPEMLASQNVEPKVVVGAKLSIDFDYARRRETQYDPAETAQEFVCTVELTDDRGSVHRGHPTNWWRS